MASHRLSPVRFTYSYKSTVDCLDGNQKQFRSQSRFILTQHHFLYPAVLQSKKGSSQKFGLSQAKSTHSTMELQMKQKGILSLLLPLPLVVFLLFLACPSVGGSCVSTCGSIKIGPPFRLADNPSNCSTSQYQLTCKLNRTLFNLFGRLHLVREISYENQTITLVDLDLSTTNCTTALQTLALEEVDGWPLDNSGLHPVDDVTNVWFVSCQQPMVNDDDSYSVTESPCSITNSTTKDYHYHYLRSKKTTVVDFKQNCTYYEFLMIYPFLFGDYSSDSVVKRTIFLSGFELSWGAFQTQYPECRSAHQSKHCFFYKLGQTLSVYVGYVLAARSGIGMLCLFSFVIFKLYRQHLRKNQSVALFLEKYKDLVPMRYSYREIFVIFKLYRQHLRKNQSVELFLEKYKDLVPMRYSYREIKRMTGGFKEKLGQGGFGSVFKGTLTGGHRLVAVKMLSKSRGDGDEFINEVATIGRIHHVNVVQLIGFCAEGSKRALVYDFMQNGSLDKYIYNKQGQSSGGSSAAMLGAQKMYEIALGTALGIEYLHRGCEMQILHFDIKPQNVLLDADFNPKISDFGLAKLYPTGRSAISLTNAKGTPGFIAPEMVYRNLGRISYKSDVYSFGRLVLEMIGQMNGSNPKVAAESVSSQFYFPAWLYDQVMKGEDVVAVDAASAQIDESESVLARRLVVVGLWCIQIKPDDRPSMPKVVEMLQATTDDLLMPPRPSLLFPPEVEMAAVETETEWSENSRLVDDEDGMDV